MMVDYNTQSTQSNKTMSDTRHPSVATDDYDHLRGNEARSHNITAARGVAEAVRSTLGPTGLDKMLISSHGTITVTNDGETVLKEIDVDHPAAKTLVEVAKTQAAEVGDGTTSAVLVASELLRTAEDLFEQGIHPTVIVDGYQRALNLTLDALNEMAERVGPGDDDLQYVAESSLSGKVVSSHSDSLAPLILEASRAVTVENTVDLEYLKTVPRAGASASNSELRHGAVLDVEPRHESMPTDVPDANVLLLQQNLEVTKPETDVRVSLDGAERRERFVEREEHAIAETLDHLEAIGVTAVLSHGRISDPFARRLSSRGILAIDHVNRTDVEFEFLREITGAIPVTDPIDVTREQLGFADISRDGLLYIENNDTHGVTLVLRGTTEPIAVEVERSVRDSINVIAQTASDGRILAGGGAPEIDVAAQLRTHAESVDERTQLAISGFADALEMIPRTLAKNTGLDPIDVLVQLRKDHASGRISTGLNADTGEIENMFDARITQPAQVTEQSVYNATKGAVILLKIDEMIIATDPSDKKKR